MRPSFFIVLSVAMLIALTQLGTARLWDRDEPRNAQCAREMLAANNWIVPTFDGELRTHKPVLLYWGQMASYRVFGVNEWSARLPSALAGVLTALLVYVTARRFASEDVATYSGIAISSMLLFAMATRAATPDGVLILSVTLAIALFARFAWQPDDAEYNHFGLRSGRAVWPTHLQWIAIYAACGLAVLAKGPVGLVLPIGVMGLTTLWVHAHADERHQAQRAAHGRSPKRLARFLWNYWDWTATIVAYGWRMRPLTALATVMLIAGPWYVAVGLQTDGVWLREFFLTHNVSRAVSTMEGHSGPPLFFYLGALLVGTFPWSCFAMPVLLAAWRVRRETHHWHPLFALATAWISIFIVAFSLASTKLPSYITPCYPGAALAAGWFVAMGTRGIVFHRRWLVAGFACAVLIGIGMAVGIAGPLAVQLPSVRPVAICGVVFAVAAMLGAALLQRTRADLAMRSFVIGAVAVTWILHGFGPAAVDAERHDLDALQAAFSEHPEARWIANGPVEPSWVFYSGGTIDRAPLPTAGDSLAEASQMDTTAIASENANTTSGPQSLSHAAAPQKTWGRIIWRDAPSESTVPIFLDDQYLRIDGPQTRESVATTPKPGRVR